MRPFSFAAALAALSLLAPAVASSAERPQHRGTLPQATVQFQAVSIDGKVVKVNKFKFFDVVLECDEGFVIVSRNKPLPAMRVNKRNRFRATFDFAGAEEVKVGGKLTNGGTQARGSLRVKGNFTDEGVRYTNCDSGKVKWST